MAIPDYQTLMRPVLQAAGGGTVRIRDVRDSLADTLHLPADEQTESIPTGKNKFLNRVEWAATYMVKAGLLYRPSRGQIALTERGRIALDSNAKIDNTYLSQYPEFVAFRQRQPSSEPAADRPAPEEASESGRAWMVLQRPEATWSDVPGASYHYPSRIPNAKRLAPGDWCAVTEPATLRRDGTRAFLGLGLVGTIDRNHGDTERTAHYDRYIELDPAVPLTRVGAALPKAAQQSITPLDAAVVDRLLALAGHSGEKAASRTAEVRIGPPDERPTFEWLQRRTLWSRDALEDVLDTLTGLSPQAVLAGPPGTGKTWVAKALAAHATDGRADGVRLVQFHPSYSYEEFIEGLRPVARGGTIAFERTDGIVLEMAGSVRPGEPRVLVIDEMNRANLPRVLGELMYLFEYRDEPIDLQYSRGFRLPRELGFVGTMNTADRSIRSLDIALRRRFDVFECPPDVGILERYYGQSGTSNQVPDLLDGFLALNEALAKELDRHHQVGHTFFMQPLLTPGAIRRTWRRKIGPLIEEYFFDRPDLAEGFTPAAFWKSLSRDAE